MKELIAPLIGISWYTTLIMVILNVTNVIEINWVFPFIPIILMAFILSVYNYNHKKQWKKKK
jgi:hypothetical protein